MTEPDFDPIAESTKVSDWEPKKVFGNNWATQYEERKRILGRELLFLNETLRVMYRLYEFRRISFVPPLTDPVAVIISACLDSAILSITKLAFDRSGMTLPKFRKQILANLTKENKKIFQSVCPESLDIEPETENELTNARNKAVAHLDKKCLFAQFGVELDKLLSVRLKLLNYFNRLAFPPHILYIPGMGEEVNKFVDTLAKTLGVEPPR